jgi:hypothetical protein
MILRADARHLPLVDGCAPQEALEVWWRAR